MLGAALLHRGELVLAFAQLDRVLEIEPMNTRARALRAATRLEFRDDRGAIADAERTLADTPRALEKLEQRAWVLAIRGEAKRRAYGLDLALTDLDESIRIDPDNAFALRSRALVHASIGDFGAARRDLARAAAVRTSDLLARTVLEKHY